MILSTKLEKSVQLKKEIFGFLRIQTVAERRIILSR